MKGNKKLLIFSILCILAGLVCLLFSGVRSGDDLVGALNRVGVVSRAEQKSQTVTESFHSLDVSVGSPDVEIYPAADGVCRLDYGETEQIRYRIRVEKDTLTVTQEDGARDRASFLLYTENPRMVIYLPEGSYESLRVACSSGDVTLQDLEAKSLEIGTGSGEISLDGLTAESAKLSCSSGDANLYELRVGSLTLKTGSGDQRLGNCSLGSLQTESSSGNIRLSGNRCEGAAVLKSGSGEIELKDDRSGSYNLSTTSGGVKLERSLSEGETQIKTGSGNIRLEKSDAASFDLRSNSGSVRGSILTEKDFILQSSSGSIRSEGGRRGAPECRVSTGSGSIRLEIAGD